LCGREIQAGHNLSERNFDAHVEACPKQSSKKYVLAQRRAARAARRGGMGSSVVPGEGQLGFPFAQVPKEIQA
jgi:hypothetical protein